MIIFIIWFVWKILKNVLYENNVIEVNIKNVWIKVFIMNIEGIISDLKLCFKYK